MGASEKKKAESETAIFSLYVTAEEKLLKKKKAEIETATLYLYVIAVEKFSLDPWWRNAGTEL